MHRNLMAEIARYGLTMNEIAELLEINRNTLQNKIDGASKFTIDEAMKIHATFFERLDIKYLFARSFSKEAS